MALQELSDELWGLFKLPKSIPEPRSFNLGYRPVVSRVLSPIETDLLRANWPAFTDLMKYTTCVWIESIIGWKLKCTLIMNSILTNEERHEYAYAKWNALSSANTVEYGVKLNQDCLKHHLNKWIRDIPNGSRDFKSASLSLVVYLLPRTEAFIKSFVFPYIEKIVNDPQNNGILPVPDQYVMSVSRSFDKTTNHEIQTILFADVSIEATTSCCGLFTTKVKQMKESSLYSRANLSEYDLYN
jgi:hypothetical protein